MPAFFRILCYNSPVVPMNDISWAKNLTNMTTRKAFGIVNLKAVLKHFVTSSGN
jgi:hypothetical protein